MLLDIYNPFYAEENAHNGANYTVELGTLIENGFDVGLNNYPIFDNNYRDELNRKIINHYFYREIAFETPGLFKRFLNRKMDEIMPYYNQLYESTLLKFEPLVNLDIIGKTKDVFDRSTRVDESTDSEAKNSSESLDSAAVLGKSDNESFSHTKSRALVSQTPQMQLAGHEDYASNITDSTSDSKSKTNAKTSTDTNSRSTTHSHSDNISDTTTDTADRYLDKAKSQQRGLSGITYSRALQQYRETFLNIDMDVIGELSELFIGLYTTNFNLL